jgi:hypothetical protein
MSGSELDELFGLVRRDLGADDVRVLEAGEEVPGAGAEGYVSCPLSLGRTLLARFSSPPADVEARQRRLEMLATSFDSTLMPARTAHPTRTSPARSLRHELAALMLRVGAVDAVVIDARSPMIWGAAEMARAGSMPAPSADANAPQAPEAAAPQGEVRPLGEVIPLSESVVEKAISAVRALPEMAMLHKGGHLHHTVNGPSIGYVARSFAAIYVLVLVFRGAFDELRAKRAVVNALPIIERLVLALPPLDPAPPIAGVVAFRRRRRR